MRTHSGRYFAGTCICSIPTLSGGSAINRRSVLSGLAAAVVAASVPTSLGASSARAQAAASAPPFIDVHHHFVPPVYLAENRDRVSPAAKQWEPQRTLDAMDAQNVATAVLSLPLPGVRFGDAQAARRMSRLCNEYAADLARSHRGRFGLFPVVPLPDIEGSLREIEYALDVLKADGIGVLTSYGDPSGSKWLGNPAFQPVFEELNRRKAVVFVHPTVPGCCQKLLPDVSPLVAEIPQDTTRAVNQPPVHRHVRPVQGHPLHLHTRGRRRAYGDGPHVRLRAQKPGRSRPKRHRIRTSAIVLRHCRHGVSTGDRRAYEACSGETDFIR
jgi:6-methylsalicylate decarboxylase